MPINNGITLISNDHEIIEAVYHTSQSDISVLEKPNPTKLTPKVENCKSMNKNPTESNKSIFSHKTSIKAHFHLIRSAYFACEIIAPNQYADVLRCDSVRMLTGNNEFSCEMRIGTWFPITDACHVTAFGWLVDVHYVAVLFNVQRTRRQREECC